MAPFNRLKAALEKVQQSGCEIEPKVQWFVEEHERQVSKDAQQLNKEHSQELKSHRNTSG